MKLIFGSHISAKTHRDFELKVFPDGEPNDFLIRCDNEEGGEMSASTCEYDFSENSVVIARTEFGPAVMGPDAPVDVSIEVHIGAEANASVIAIAEAEAKKLASQAGIKDHADEDDFTKFRIIRH